MTLGTPQTHVPASRRLRVVAIGGLVVAYVCIFFTTPIPSLGRHAVTGEPHDRLTLLLWQVFHLPTLVSEWFGGEQSGLTSLVDRLPVVSLAAVILGAAYGVGRGVLNLLGLLGNLTRTERIAFGTGLGLNALSLLTLFVGLLGWLREPVGLAVLAGCVLTLLLLNWSTGRLRGRMVELPPSGEFGPVDRGLIAGILIFSGLILLGSMLPPWHFDVKAYHLQAPKEWYQSGAIGFMPHNVYANMPLGAEMHALLAMMLWTGEEAWWWGAIVGNVVIASFAPLTALALYAFGRRFFSTTSGLLAAFLFLSTPWVAFLSFTGLIEGGLGFYLLLAVYALVLQSQTPTKQTVQTRWQRNVLILAGLCAGGAAACKYPAVAFVVLPLLAAVAWPRLFSGFGSLHGNKDGRRIAWSAVPVFLGGVLVACGPWYAKNLALTGNPTYPLLYSAFGGETWNEEKHERWTTAHTPPIDKAGRSYSLAQLADSAAVLGWKSTGHSVLLVPFAAIAMLSATQRKRLLPLLVIVIYCILVWWLLTHRFGRFVTPLLPVISLLAAVGTASLLATRARRLVVAILVVAATSNALLITSSALGDNRFFMALADARASRVSTMHRFLNESLGKEDRVLLVGDATPFDLEVSHIYNTCFDDCRFTQLVQGKDAAARRAAFEEAGITHVCFSWIDIAAYRREGDHGYSPYVSRRRVYADLVESDRLLRPVDTGVAPHLRELFQVTDRLPPGLELGAARRSREGNHVSDVAHAGDELDDAF